MDQFTLHYINLDRRQDRRKHMEDEFRNQLPDNYSLVRWPAIQHTNGWMGCIQSHSSLLKNITANNNSNMYCVLEDDCVINNKKTFKELLPKYIKYLKEHSSEWDLFLAGGVSAEKPIRIVTTDPFIIECNWFTCSHFVIYNNKSANNVITYSDSNKYNTGIDNFNARSNRRRIWIPYPLLCDQLGIDTDIGNFPEYLPNIVKSFKDTHIILNEFVKNHYKLLLVIPGFGNPQFDFKKSILLKNINTIRNTFTGKVDITVFNYDSKSVGIECNEIMKKGYIGQFIYNHLQPNIVNNYHYVILLLDDIELNENINIDTMIRNYNHYNLDIISPSLNLQSKYSHQYMLQQNTNKIRLTQCLEFFCYLMKPSSYTKWYNLLDNKSCWLWGIDYAMFHYNISTALMDTMTITHHIKGSAYKDRSVPNPYNEYNYNSKRLKLQSQNRDYTFVEMI
jgi:GR25 family glycosyltransferase involved in LPS biosynthesis